MVDAQHMPERISLMESRMDGLPKLRFLGPLDLPGLTTLLGRFRGSSVARPAITRYHRLGGWMGCEMLPAVAVRCLQYSIPF